MPAKDIEVGSRLPFVILLELFLTLETETLDHFIYYGRLFQLAGKKSFCCKVNLQHLYNFPPWI